MKLFLATFATTSLLIAGSLVLVSDRATPSVPSVQVELGIGELAPASPSPDENEVQATIPLDLDLLRIEDDSILLAGRGAPDSDVEILLGDSTAARVRTDRSGGFVYVHEGAPKSYTFRLRSEGRLSDQVAVVAPAGKDVLALITAPEEATTIVQTPFAEPSDTPGVTVEAVEVDAGEIFVAGKAADEGDVRVYLDGEFIGEVRANADRRYLLRVPRSVEAGRHDVRADLVKSDATVAARAEVPLVHQPVGSTDMLEDDPQALRTGVAIIIRPGDSLWRISRRAYGRGTRYTTIFEANRSQIRDPDRIFAGQILKLPTDRSDRDVR